MSPPEVLLWTRLRKSPGGVSFRRQHPLEGYVVDFFCAQARVCIEIDGIVHDMGDNPERDAARAAALEAQGFEVLRVAAADVLRSADDVADALVRHCKRD